MKLLAITAISFSLLASVANAQQQQGVTVMRWAMWTAMLPASLQTSAPIR